ncbi:MAG: DNA repair protein RecO [Bacillota bacterium]
MAEELIVTAIYGENTMRDFMVDAIILKSARTKEADRVLTLYTRQMGKTRAMAYGVEKPASRKRGAVQPFSYSRLLLKKGKDIDSVSQGEGLEIFPALRKSLEGLAGASYFCELVDAFTLDGDPNTAVFELMLGAFHMLGRDCDISTCRAFEIKLMSNLGYRPGLDACVFCGSPAGNGEIWFSPGQGGIICNECSTGVNDVLALGRGSLETLKALLRWDMERIYQIKTDPRAGREIKAIMKKFIEYQLEKNIKSARFVELVGTTDL